MVNSRMYMHNFIQNKNIVWQNAIITRACRERRTGHRGAILWFTGLSGAGKSTLAHLLEQRLYNLGCNTYVLDGDNIRHGLCKDLGFTLEARRENIRRIGEVSKLLMEAGIIVMSAFISPIQKDRDTARGIVTEGDFFEVFCNAPLSVCEERDVKGLYKKARSGEIANFTGISSPYEIPINPDLEIDTSALSIEESLSKLLKFLVDNKIIASSLLADKSNLGV
jgi:adenylylsulfate kinase